MSSDKILLYELAKHFTALGYLVIPEKLVFEEVRVKATGNGGSNTNTEKKQQKVKKKPLIKWSEDERDRNNLLSEEELIYWFSESISDRDGNCRADGFGIALKGKDDTGPIDLAMDTDGPEATQEYEEEFLPRCPEEIQDAHQKTTLTITPSKGKHWLMGIKNRQDFPKGISQSSKWCDITIETANQKHSQINLLGTNHMLNEYLPGYFHIRGIENKVDVSTEVINQYLELLEEFKIETSIIITIGNFIKPFYVIEHRDEIVFATSGYLWKYGRVPVNLTIRLFKHVMRVTAYEDEDWNKTIQTIKDTYAKDPDSGDVSGQDRILQAFNLQESVIREIEQGFKQINQEFFPEVSFEGFNDKNGNKNANGKVVYEEKKIPKPERKDHFVQFYSEDNVFAEAVTIGKVQRFAMVNTETRQVSLIREITIDTDWDKEGNVTKQTVFRPLGNEDYMHKPYIFESEKDFFMKVDFVKNQKLCTLDGIYHTIKRVWSQYIDAEDSHLVICAADTIFSYFQDVIGLTHYLWFVGDNDSGKSNNLWVLHYLAYRNMMSLGISAANVYQFLGSGEEGIGTICEDEANQIDEDKDKMELAKSGYTKGFPVVKITISNDGQRYQKRYNTFCFKAYSAEKAPDPVKAKGMIQRLVKLRCIAGDPSVDILEVINPMGDVEMLDLLKELHGVRNLLLCYRLEHRNDKIPNVKVNLKNREKQLFKPLLRLFYGTEAMDEVQRTLSKYVNERRKAKLSGINAFLIQLVQDMLQEASYNDLTISQTGIYEVPTNDIWTKVKTRTDATTIPGHPLTCETTQFGPISHKRVIEILENVFKAEVKTSNSTRIVRFDKKVLDDVFKSYATDEVKILVSEYKPSSSLSSISTDSTLSTDSGGMSPPVDDNEKSEK
jgi:hypothetical protein